MQTVTIRIKKQEQRKKGSKERKQQLFISGVGKSREGVESIIVLIIAAAAAAVAPRRERKKITKMTECFGSSEREREREKSSLATYRWIETTRSISNCLSPSLSPMATTVRL